MLIASFVTSVSELGSDITIKDTTDYTQEPKGTINTRVLKIVRSDGSYYPNGLPIPFNYLDYPNDTIVIPNIDRDYALSISLELTANSPVPGSLYTKTITKVMNSYLMQFLFGINQELAANPAIARKANFIRNLMEVVVMNTCAKNAGSTNNLAAAQFALDKANQIISNKNLYF